jgi:hypothetical protein
MKIARFKYIGDYSYDTVASDELEDSKSYVRTSEYVEVEFPPLKSDEVVQRQLEALERVEDELRGKFQTALNQINRQREELRAITYQG